MLCGFILLLLLSGGNASSGEASAFTEVPSHQQVAPLPLHPGNKEETVNSVKPNGKCSYQDVLTHLNLSRNSDLYSLTRPVRHHNSTTVVRLVMVISAILDVMRPVSLREVFGLLLKHSVLTVSLRVWTRETDQTFISYIWIYSSWYNEHIRWDPEEFCALEHVKVPTELLWKPDVIIEEMIEKDKAPPSLYLVINWDGEVQYRSHQVVISTCKMHVYRFPFDIQRCNISFRSLIHSDEELQFDANMDNRKLTNWSRTVMQTQYEWLFINLTVSNKTDHYSIGSNQTTIIYTIHMKRRSVLYIANFLLPVLFLLCLDLSSFLISDRGGEKISFKVTVMLAVTVMQLVLNDILPCSSDNIPLIAVFCIGIFALMMLSLLETILMTHLMEKDAASRDETSRDPGPNRDTNQTGLHGLLLELKKCTNSASISDVSDNQTPSEAKEGSSSQLTEVSLALGKVSDELERIQKTAMALGGRNEQQTLGHWTRVAKQINRIFISFYISAVTVFLVVIFSVWCFSEEH